MRDDLELFRFCPACGGQCLARDGRKALHCSDCDFRYFHNTAAAVALLLQVDDRLLFTRRARDPAAGLLDFPGGFVDPDETAEAALLRELAEELDLDIVPGELRYLFSGCNRYPYAGVGYYTVDLFFGLRLTELPRLVCADDVEAAEWHPLDAVPDAELAFDTVRRATARLREMAR